MSFTLLTIHFLFVRLVLCQSPILEHPVLNPRTCGQNRLSFHADDQCFEWHKIYGTDNIKNGRNATLGEAPWTAYIRILILKKDINGKETHQESSGTGALIADKWILTAAHNLIKGQGVIKHTYIIILGANFTWSEFKNLFKHDNIEDYQRQLTWMKVKYYVVEEKFAYINPNYETVRTNLVVLNETVSIDIDLSDLGLIYLVQGPKIDNINKDLAIVNNICLPWNQYRETMGSYGLVSGYGMMGPNITYKSFPNQMTYLKLDNQFKWPLISAITVDGQGTLCSGDSGGPLWQYHMGRAVLIGIHTQGFNDEHHCGIKGYPLLYTRVSYYIDWIQYTILNLPLF